jgi:HAD superfamily hydrolase (TIGR01509 family)
MAIRGVIFDLDGTLVDSGLDFHAIRHEMGLPFGVPILEALAEIDPGPRLDGCLRILDRHECAGAARATLMPGARELLDRLSSRGVPTGVFTRNNRASTAHVLERLGLRFDCVLTREDGPPKPDPRGLLRICSIWRMPVADVIFVGDYLHDINCGRAAGMRTMLYAPQGMPHYSHLADFCVADFKAADRLFDELLQSGKDTESGQGQPIPE